MSWLIGQVHFNGLKSYSVLLRGLWRLALNLFGVGLLSKVQDLSEINIQVISQIRVQGHQNDHLSLVTLLRIFK
jgi:hypothetical protein